MIIYKYDDLWVRSLEKNDVQIISKWLSDEELLQYYEGRDCPHDEQLVLKNYFCEEDETVRCIIEYKAVPIGYIQFYLLGDEERAEYGYEGNGGIIYGIDQFIGETSYWNKGIGTMVVESMVNYLFKEKRADLVVMDPQSWNYRALACYEKCGFVRKKLLEKHEMHEGEKRDCWLMERVFLKN